MTVIMYTNKHVYPVALEADEIFYDDATGHAVVIVAGMMYESIDTMGYQSYNDVFSVAMVKHIFDFSMTSVKFRLATQISDVLNEENDNSEYFDDTKEAEEIPIEEYLKAAAKDVKRLEFLDKRILRMERDAAGNETASDCKIYDLSSRLGGNIEKDSDNHDGSDE